MANPTRILVVVQEDNAYGRAVFGGTSRYVRMREGWVLQLVSTRVPDLIAFHADRCDGAVVMCNEQFIVDCLAGLGGRWINVSSRLLGLDLPHVLSDDVTVGRLVAEHLLQRGLSHFAFIGEPTHGASHRRLAGFRQRLGDTPVTEIRSSYRGDMARELANLPRPVGLFCWTDHAALQCSQALMEAEISVPDECAIIGVDNDTMLCEALDPGLTSVDQNGQAIGYQAAALLDRLLTHGRPNVDHVIFPPVGVVARGSTDAWAIDDPVVRLASQFIAAHATERIGVDDVATAAGVPRRTLERRFRDKMHRTVADAIREATVNRIRELLSGSDLTVAQIAEMCGLSRGEHLSRFFKRETGITPSEYRKRKISI